MLCGELCARLGCEGPGALTTRLGGRAARLRLGDLQSEEEAVAAALRQLLEPGEADSWERVSSGRGVDSPLQGWYTQRGEGRRLHAVKYCAPVPGVRTDEVHLTLHPAIAPHITHTLDATRQG